MAAPSKRDIKWIDGLRGVASFLVLTAHILRSLAPHVIEPAMSDILAPTWYQLPFFRVLTQGRASVAMFAILTGYVNALKPIKLSKTGDYETALNYISTAAFRRVGRFVLPATVATILSWFICQLGAYKIGARADSEWIKRTSPKPSSSIIGALGDLVWNWWTSWVNGANKYEATQWTLIFLLKSSMMVYLFMFATLKVQPRWRMALCGLLYTYFWSSGDALVGINFTFGMFFAEFTHHAEIQQFIRDYGVARRVVAFFSIFVGLYLCSYPESHADWVPWSSELTDFGNHIFHHPGEINRMWLAVGTQMIIFGVAMSTTAQNLLSGRYLLWMGSQGFYVYLIHAPLIRTVLAWLVFGFNAPIQKEGVDDKGKPFPPGNLAMSSPAVVWMVMPFFYACVYFAAYQWGLHVEPFCARVCKRLEDILVSPESKEGIVSGFLSSH